MHVDVAFLWHAVGAVDGLVFDEGVLFMVRIRVRYVCEREQEKEKYAPRKDPS